MMTLHNVVLHPVVFMCTVQNLVLDAFSTYVMFGRGEERHSALTQRHSVCYYISCLGVIQALTKDSSGGVFH